MQKYTPKQKKAIEELKDFLIEDVDQSLLFLNVFFNDYDCDELGCCEITNIVNDYIRKISFGDLKDLIQNEDYGNDFNLTMFDFEEDTLLDEGEIKKPCKNPCPECPYRNNSVKGYFGEEEPEIYSDAIHKDTVVACHTKTKHSKSGVAEKTGDVVICTGHIVAQIKTCKSNRSEFGAMAHEHVKSQDNLEKLKEQVLGFDFKEYHGI